jgi:hypothetical protein
LCHYEIGVCLSQLTIIKKTVSRTKTITQNKVSKSTRAVPKRNAQRRKAVSKVKLRHKIGHILLGRKVAHHKSLHITHGVSTLVLIVSVVIAGVLAGNGKWVNAADTNASCTGMCKGIAGAAKAYDKYWIVGQDGGVFSFNAPFYGSVPQTKKITNAVGIASTPTQIGYYIFTSTGEVFAYGNAVSKGGSPGANNIVGFALRPQNDGYWMVGADGGVFAYGNAAYKGGSHQIDPTKPAGGTNSFVPNKPMVGIVGTKSGNGYWMVGADGGVFAFGDAVYRGSSGQIDPSKPAGGSNSFVPYKPIVGMATTPTGNGYWMVGADGGVFAFGDAVYRGSSGQIDPSKPAGGSNSFVPAAPVVNMAVSPSGNGYWLVATDGAIYSFGDARYGGRVASQTPLPAVIDTHTNPAPTKNHKTVQGGGTELVPISCPGTFEETLRLGTKGECVREAKRLLADAQARGEFTFDEPVDANNDTFDTSMRGAVMKYQKAKSISPSNGDVDAITWKHLRMQVNTTVPLTKSMNSIFTNYASTNEPLGGASVDRTSTKPCDYGRNTSGNCKPKPKNLSSSSSSTGQKK